MFKNYKSAIKSYSYACAQCILDDIVYQRVYFVPSGFKKKKKKAVGWGEGKGERTQSYFVFQDFSIRDCSITGSSNLFENFVIN